MKRIYLHLLLTLVVAFGLMSCSTSGLAPQDITSPAAIKAMASADAMPIESGIIAEVNRFRRERGKRPIKYSKILSQIARKHSVTQATTQTMGHEGFQNRLFQSKKAGIPFMCENVGYLAGSGSASNIVNRWSHSPKHRANMVGPYSLAGVSAVKGSGKTYFTLLLGSPGLSKVRPGSQPGSPLRL